MNPRSGGVDRALFLVVIIVSQGFAAFLPGSPTSTAIIISSVIMAFVVLRELDRGLAVLFANPLVFFVAAWSVAASLLSPRPGTALALAGVFILTIVFSAARESSPQCTIKTVALATTISLIPSLVGLVAPIFPVLSDAGSAHGYAGYFPWNSSAGLCAAAALLCTALTFSLSGFAWWQLPAAAGALLMLDKSASATATLTLVAAGTVVAVRALLRGISARMRPLAIVAAAALAILLAPTAAGLISVFSVARITDRTDSLSGRTQIWEWAREGIAESPYWGYGTEFWRARGEWNNSGHNGFIDIAISSGVPALLAICAIIAVAAVRLARASSLMLPLLAFGVTTNLVGSQLAVPAVGSLAIWLSVGTTLRTDALKLTFASSPYQSRPAMRATPVPAKKS